MATTEQLAELRRLVDEPTQDPYTDAVLSLRIDAAGSIQGLAATIWREKAASFAGLVDVREGNSDRKLSQLHKQAIAMAESFEAGVLAVGGDRRPTTTRRIERQ